MTLFLQVILNFSWKFRIAKWSMGLNRWLSIFTIMFFLCLLNWTFRIRSCNCHYNLACKYVHPVNCNNWSSYALGRVHRQATSAWNWDVSPLCSGFPSMRYWTCNRNRFYRNRTCLRGGGRFPSWRFHLRRFLFLGSSSREDDRPELSDASGSCGNLCMFTGFVGFIMWVSAWPSVPSIW